MVPVRSISRVFVTTALVEKLSVSKSISVVLSVIVPLGFGEYVNRVHYCVPADMETLVPGLAQAIVDAFEETVVEDHDLVERRHDGMVAARSLGLTLDNYVPNLGGTALEAGVSHFHDWWSRTVGVPELV